MVVAGIEGVRPRVGSHLHDTEVPKRFAARTKKTPVESIPLAFEALPHLFVRRRFKVRSKSSWRRLAIGRRQRHDSLWLACARLL
jgi:hypothetical protein